MVGLPAWAQEAGATLAALPPVKEALAFAERTGVALLRVAYPLLLVALPMFMALFGAPAPAVVAMACATALIAVSFKPVTHPRRRMQIIAGAIFALAVVGGLPGALYTFSTESCVGEAQDHARGDVRGLDDPRLTAADRAWIARSQALLSLAWPKDLPALDATALANILVRGRGVMSQIAWRPDEPPERTSVWEVKEAYAARYFDRRRVCHLYHGGDYASGPRVWGAQAGHIARTTEHAVALIIPALQATYIRPQDWARAQARERTLAELSVVPVPGPAAPAP